MIVSLDNARRGRLLLQPVRDSRMALIGLEIIHLAPDARSVNDVSLFTDKLAPVSYTHLTLPTT